MKTLYLVLLLCIFIFVLVRNTVVTLYGVLTPYYTGSQGGWAAYRPSHATMVLACGIGIFIDRLSPSSNMYQISYYGGWLGFNPTT